MSKRVRRGAAAALVLFCCGVLPLLGQQTYTMSTFAGSGGGPGAVDASGTQARLSEPSGVTRDPSGNLYVADRENQTIRKISAGGVVTTLAGLAGSPENVMGRGAAARFAQPMAIAYAQGALYVTDSYGVKKVTLDGEVSGLAALNFAQGVAVDGDGYVYATRSNSHAIYRITAGGTVSVFAGSPSTAGTADGDRASARFANPGHLAFDNGTLYVADTTNHTIRAISGDSVSTLAGLAGTQGYQPGTGSAARFTSPIGVTVDPSGDLFVTDNSRLLKVTVPEGTMTVFAGSSTGGFGEADGTGTAARFRSPRGVICEPDGTVYVADTGNHVVRKVTPAQEVTTFAGAPSTAAYFSGPVAAAQARFWFPYGVTVDSAGSVYATSDDRVLKISGGVVSVFASGFAAPHGLASDGSNVFVADTFNYTVRRITSAGAVSILAGTTGVSGSANGPGATATFNRPESVAVDTQGNVYVADTGNHVIRRIAPDGQVSTFAGTSGVGGAADGPRLTATFNVPQGVAVDADGNVFVADTGNHIIRRIDTSGQVTRIAGVVGSPGGEDGVGSGARFLEPRRLAALADGSVLVVDGGGQKIRHVTANGVVNSVAGSYPRNGSADATGASARFNDPYGIAVDAAGNIYVADRVNNKYRKGTVALADIATIDAASGVIGVSRQLGAGAGTGTSFSWRQTRVPARSAATLSSTSIANPTFTPDVPDVYEFELTASNGTQSSVTTVALRATCPSIAFPSPASLPKGYPGTPYSATFAAANGTAPYEYFVTEGALPPGLTLAVSGALDGTPTTAGSYNFAVTVKDAVGCSAVRAFTLVVNRAPTLSVAPAGALTAAEGSTVTINVTASDADGDPITIAVAGTATGLSPDAAQFTGTGNTRTFQWTPGYDRASYTPYTATFTVSDGAVTTSGTVEITVINTNRAPTLSVAPAGALTAAEGSTVTINVTASDADGDPITIAVAGTAAGLSPDAAQFTGTGNTRTFQWAPGYDRASYTPYTATFTASDGAVTTSGTVEITVINTNRPPVWSLAPGISRRVGSAAEDVQFGTVSDPDEGPSGLTVTAESMPVGLWTTDFLNDKGTIRSTLTVGCSATPGTWSIAMKVTDSDGAWASVNFPVEVLANAPPSLGTYADTILLPGGSTGLLPSFAPADDNGNVFVSVFGSQSFTGDFLLFQKSGGVTIGNANEGTHTITVTVSDGCGLMTQRPFQLTVGKAAATPTFTSSMNPAPAGTAVQFTAGLAVPPLSPTPYFAAPVIPDSGALIIPYRGRLFDAADTPVDSPQLNVRFSLYDASQQGQLLFTEVYPVSVQDGYFSARVGDTTNGHARLPETTFDNRDTWLEVSVNDGPPLLPRLAFGPAQPPSGTSMAAYFKLLSSPSVRPTGAVTVKAGVTTLGSGSLEGVDYVSSAWTVNASLPRGSHAMTAEFGGDDNYLPLTASLTQTMTNRAPELAEIASPMAAENSPLTFTVSAADPDGDVPTFAAAPLPAGASFNTTTGAFSWTPSYSQAGTYTLTFSVSDGYGGSDSQEITITVTNTNRPPVLVLIGNRSVAENANVNFTVTATDDDNDGLTYSAAPLPAGATFNATTGVFDWTPTLSQSGSHSITFGVSDGNGGSDEEVVVITVTNQNQNPVLGAIGNRSVDENAALTFTLTATDPDNDTLTFGSTTLPAGAALNATTGVFTWTPAYTQSGVHSITFSVSDGNGGTDNEAITITVNNVNRPPALQPVGNRSVRVPATLSFTLAGSDPDLETLTYSATGLPAGATLNPSSGLFSWTPTPGQVGGNYQITFKVADGSAAEATATATIVVLAAVAVRSDFDADGRADIFWRHATSGMNWMYRMNGNAVTASQYVNSEGNFDWQIVGIADFDGDGKSDVLWRNKTTGKNWLYRMDGNLVTGQLINTEGDLNWKVAAVGDFDGDGRADIFWRHAVTGANWMYLMNGNIILASLYVQGEGDLNWQIAAVGDFNGDGKADLFWRHATSGVNWVALMNGATIQSSGVVNAEGDPNWKIAGAGDFDGDGSTDVLWRNTANGINYLYRMNGTTATGQWVNAEGDQNWKVANVADFDGDGMADILWRHAVTGQNWMYRMNGNAIAASLYVQGEGDTNWKVQR